MQSYAIFRIAETIRIVLFMTLAIVVFNFYPITALMIILLALLNDIPILVSSFLLFFILQEQGFSHEMIRSLLFLKLIVAGHSTLYLTRARGWFWQRPWPAPLLFGATFGTEILATLIAAEGWLMAPIGWTYALMIWGYALAWFLVNDGVKMATLRFLRQRNGG
jgi:H+-transporting ATPase